MEEGPGCGSSSKQQWAEGDETLALNSNAVKSDGGQALAQAVTGASGWGEGCVPLISSS